MQRYTATVIATLLVLPVLNAQQQQPPPNLVYLPSLSIAGTTVESKVTYDSSRSVYRYEYRVNAPATNKAAIDVLKIDVSGRKVRPQIDPDLQTNVELDLAREKGWQPATTIPVGLIVPNASMDDAGVGKEGHAYFGFGGKPKVTGDAIEPGTSVGGSIIESKQPPGWRKAEISPSVMKWVEICYSGTYPRDTVFYPESDDRYIIKTKVIAPLDYDPATLYSGGGQSPAEVNPFLRYAYPTDNRLHLAAGTTSYEILIVYGATTDPATFTATLNGADVKAMFKPMPGIGEVVKIPLVSGTNKLQLSIEGKTSSGRLARDTDTLTFLVP